MNRDRLWNELNVKSKDELGTTCPKCQKSALAVFKYAEHITPDGKEQDRMNYPFGIEYNFVGLLKCQNPKCGTIVNVAGFVEKDIEQQGHDENGEYFECYFDIIKPNYFSPNLRCFEVNQEVPKEVVKIVDLAFYHYFNDFNASANKVRTAIELILDDIKASKSRYNQKGKRIIFKNLHDRIIHFGKRNKYISTLMLANKYVGNEGSHIGEVKQDELLSAFENLEEILNHLYVKTKRKLLARAEKLIKEKVDNK